MALDDVDLFAYLAPFGETAKQAIDLAHELFDRQKFRGHGYAANISMHALRYTACRILAHYTHWAQTLTDADPEAMAHEIFEDLKKALNAWEDGRRCGTRYFFSAPSGSTPSAPPDD